MPNLDQLKEKLKSEPVSENETNNAENAENNPEQDLSQNIPEESPTLEKEKLDKHWDTFKSQLKDAGKSTEVAILNQPYSLPTENMIELRINSVLQEDILERFKIELLGYLREKCDNPAIKLQTKMVQEVKQKKLYTSQDKLNYLAENNPHVLELQRRLGLDIDF